MLSLVEGSVQTIEGNKAPHSEIDNLNGIAYVNGKVVVITSNEDNIPQVIFLYKMQNKKQ